VRKLVLILIAFFAVVTFIRAFTINEAITINEAFISNETEDLSVELTSSGIN